MSLKNYKATLRQWMLPIAMLGGILFYNIMPYLSPLSPYLIGVMLFLTYCRLNPKEMRVTKFSVFLLLAQIGGGTVIYFILLPFGDIVAQTAFICVFCPTATAAPVITGMLGGSITRLAAFSLVSNISVAILAPVLFSIMNSSGHEADFTFIQITGLIALKVIPLILGPLALALILEWFSPSIHARVGSHQNISFYVWAVSLFIVVGNAVSYVIEHLNNGKGEGTEMVLLACISLVLCCAQFYIGRRIGYKFGDKVAGAQGLGQKNTVLAIWMALTFLNPITSIGPAAYVAWQNTINSWQIWRKNKNVTVQA